MGREDERRKLTAKHYTLAGATSGIVARIIGQPLDVLKIRFQIQNAKDGTLKYVGVVSSAKNIVQEEGLAALWKGHVPAQALSVIFGAVQFTTYELSYKRVTNAFPKYTDATQAKAGIEFLCGGLSGISSTMVCQPIDVVRTRLVAQTGNQIYKSIFHAIRLMIQENGLRTFYKGLIPTMSMVVPNNGLHFAFYGTFKRTWLRFLPTQDGSDKKLMRLLCGSASGLCSKLILLPLDVVKKRLQVEGLTGYHHYRYTGMVDCFRTVIQKEGMSALYRGATPSVFKAAVVSGVTFFTYEHSLDILSNWNI